MTSMAVRVDLHRFCFDNVFYLLESANASIVTGVRCAETSLSIIAIALFLLAKVAILVVILHLPVKIVVSGMLNDYQLNSAVN